MINARALATLAAIWSTGLGGCYPADQFPKEHQAALAPQEAVKEEPLASRIDWAKAPDCRGKLKLLQQGLLAGSIRTLKGTPFSLVSDRRLATPAGWSGHRQLEVAGLQAPSGDSASRCLIRLGETEDHRAEHRVLSREQVRSSFQSGSHREKNPAYDAAQARLRQAERANKPGKSSLISVGDPLIDLVGTLVGGALTGIGQWGEGDQVEEAIDALMATPRSVEHPVYRSYHFERKTIRASREAIVPMTLTDRDLRRSWRISLKRREVKDLAVLDGLDRQDRNYAQYRQDSMTGQEFRQWQAEPPEMPLEDMIAGLLGAPALASVDRAAGFGEPEGRRALPGGDAGLDAAALPPAAPPRPASGKLPGARSVADTPAKTTARLRESLVNIIGADHEGEGVYVAPSLVLTTSDLVEGHGLIDVRDGFGGSVLGLVVKVDKGRGLALIQVPRTGMPVLIEAGWPTSSSRADISSYAGKPGGTEDYETVHRSGPILKGRRLLGLRSQHGPDISAADISAFLSEQDTLLLAEEP